MDKVKHRFIHSVHIQGPLTPQDHAHAGRAHTSMKIKIPLRNNKKQQVLMDRINADQELFQLWKCANVNAVDRSGISDHGEIHIRIVANAALRIIRLFEEQVEIVTLKTIRRGNRQN